jgi:hypothetical protein
MPGIIRLKGGCPMNHAIIRDFFQIVLSIDLRIWICHCLEALFIYISRIHIIIPALSISRILMCASGISGIFNLGGGNERCLVQEEIYLC